MDDELQKRSLSVDEVVDGHAWSGNGGHVVLQSMSAPVSPPRKRRRARPTDADAEAEADAGADAVPTPEATTEPATQAVAEESTADTRVSALVTPFRLTTIRDLPAAANAATVTLRDLIGDPHVTACWEFNYLHDVDFLVGTLHPDVQHRRVPVHIVHGFWKREDPRRQRLEAAAARYDHVRLHAAYLPVPFGTHHTKMMVVFRRRVGKAQGCHAGAADGDGDDNVGGGDTAEVIIHTANLITHDWANMTQAVWRSPQLPRLRAPTDAENPAATAADTADTADTFAVGSGPRFKNDLLNYLRAYDVRPDRPVCRPLVNTLAQYDFSAVRGVLIGSVPGRHRVVPSGGGGGDHRRRSRGGDVDAFSAPTQWGWAAMQRVLQSVPLQRAGPSNVQNKAVAPPEIVLQISSIATLGPTDAWLRRTLFAALAGGREDDDADNAEDADVHPLQKKLPAPQFRILFPTADEIRRSLDGYVSGTSIHTKTESPQQQKQLQYLRPLLCHWANDAPRGAALPVGGPSGPSARRDAGRARAAAHVKTYVRYGPGGSDGGDVDWALLTSANLSKQAWGDAAAADGTLRISSYELGVLVWPGLFAPVARMRPVFGRDTWGDDGHDNWSDGVPGDNTADDRRRPVVPLRIPYNLPLQRYGPGETPWVGTQPHAEPDWKGEHWPVQ
ncbi:Tyrosyl-DNA phosphodiesterase [Niveomyces insectorum RCEF 264]|uniref:Tyrosyl-DNA phosphodiesterase n=1 Tax=Niveomyces insectorum RCEF 264 TaxID=1081102 RepID=A0A167QYD2_9HYPO|nr:Tyrosyl-DNA phosphodiesterase [Niveomyces insectorum RCEF 264]